jgi:hypothetical protein
VNDRRLVSQLFLPGAERIEIPSSLPRRVASSELTLSLTRCVLWRRVFSASFFAYGSLVTSHRSLALRTF